MSRAPNYSEADLFSITHARRDDPYTSHLAAAQAHELAKAHHRKILSFLKSISPQGATVEEIADGTWLEKHAVFRRMNELKEAKLAYTIEGDVKRLSTGRMGRVWRAA